MSLRPLRSGRLLECNPAEYVPHALHRHDRTYVETNCYTDVLVELLHARGEEPLAAMGCLARMDFEGDQWTFFKPPAGDLELLFGVDIHEMQPYRPLPEQIAEQLQEGRTVIVELDSWYLPDTVATSYRSEHVKTSVAAAEIDLDAQHLSYFHNAGLFSLAGEDYRGVFRLDPLPAPDVLPPYTELVRFDLGVPLRGDDLRRASLGLFRAHLARRPRTNPFVRFGERLADVLPELLAGDASTYHAYAFATVRMAGSSFEILASYVTWLLGDAAAEAADSLGSIVAVCKTLSFKLARRRAFDPTELVTEAATAWDEAMASLDALVA